MEYTVDVIIPVYKPDVKLKKIISRLAVQTYPVNRLILINTEKRYFDEYFGNDGFLKKYPFVSVSHIRREDFDHGGTRRAAVSESDADFFVCMTDDAIPRNDRLIENLLAPLIAGKAEVSYGRQLPGKGCSVAEAANRHFNYPAKSCIKGKEDLKTMGIKTFFCSDVCAAYRRDIYDELGGFEGHMIFNEDMVFARSVINAGYHIAYAADAEVFHSHSYNIVQYTKRSFDLGVSQAMYPEVFSDISSESEGIKLVKRKIGFYIKKRSAQLIPLMIITDGFRYIGYKAGKKYRKLPSGAIELLTMNKEFWK